MRESSKRPVQQGRRLFGERSVEHDKGPRTPLADFFNTPHLEEHRVKERKL
jgi:hypothetical protein